MSSDGEDAELCYLDESIYKYSAFLPGYTDDLSHKVIATFPVWGPGYEISFEFYLKSAGNTDTWGYQTLLAVTSRGSSGPGDGQPGIYHIDGNIAIWFRVNGNNQGKPYGHGDTLGLWKYPYGNDLDWEVELEKWHHVSVSSIMESGKVS